MVDPEILLYFLDFYTFVLVFIIHVILIHDDDSTLVI